MTHLKHSTFYRPFPQLFVISTNLRNAIITNFTSIAHKHTPEHTSTHLYIQDTDYSDNTAALQQRHCVISLVFRRDQRPTDI